MAYVYLHKTKNDGTPFYIGISSKDDGYSRSKNKKRRNPFWKAVVDKYDYEIEILKDGISFDEAKELEVKYIKEYKENGHRLVNMTEGGDGTVGFKLPKAQKRRLAESQAKRKIITIGGLIEKLKQYDLDSPVYIGHVKTDMLNHTKLEYFDGVSVLNRKMVAHDTDDDDGRWYDADSENCVVLFQHSKYDWVKEQFELEVESRKLDSILTYDETLTSEQSNELQSKQEQIYNRLKIKNQFGQQ